MNPNKSVLLCVALMLSGCGGNDSTNPLAVTDDEPQSEQPALVPQPLAAPNSQGTPEPVPLGFGTSGVLGNWYCATTFVDFNGNNRADWNNPSQLNFSEDRTVIRRDGSETLSTWEYIPNGVAIQWPDEDETAEYQLNVDDYEGMTDDSSNCLRELPPAEPNPVNGIWFCQDLFSGGRNYVTLVANNNAFFQDSEWFIFDGGTKANTALTPDNEQRSCEYAAGEETGNAGFSLLFSCFSDTATWSMDFIGSQVLDSRSGTNTSFDWSVVDADTITIDGQNWKFGAPGPMEGVLTAAPQNRDQSARCFPI